MRTATTYTTREIRDATRAGWDGWLEDSPGGGRVLQSYEWGEFKKRQGWRPVRLVLERDSEVAGAGQFLAYDAGPFVPGSLRYCTKGPWLPWEDEEAVRAFFEGVREVAGRLGAHTVKIEPEVIEEQKDTKALLGEIGFQKARYDLNHKTTIILDLRPSEEELLARMKGKTRYNVRLVARKGVGVEETGFKEAWDTFYGLLEGTVERNGFAIRRSHEYLHDSMRAMYDAGQGRFFFAAYEGELLAAISSSPSVRSAGTSTAPRATRGATSCLPLAVGGNALGQIARDKVLRYGGGAQPREPRRRRPLVRRLPVQSGLRPRSRGLPRLPRPTHQAGARRCVVQVRARVLPAVPEAEAERVLLEAVSS